MPSSSSIRLSSVLLLLLLLFCVADRKCGEVVSSPGCCLLDESAMLGDVGHVPIGVYDTSEVTGDVLSGLAC